MTIWGIVVAAGAGSRFGSPKHVLELDGVALWQRARDDLLAGGVDSVVVVGDVPGGFHGGRRRQDSVAAGLAQVAADAAYVLVHDAARPLAGADVVNAVLERLGQGDVDGVVPAVPVGDTLKRVQGSSVLETVDRSDLVAVQTPQGFRADMLRRAHREVTSDVTDDAQMIEAIGGSVVTVAGSARNLKVTHPADLDVAAALL